MKKYKPFQSLIAIVLVVITVFSTVSVSAEPLSEAVKADQATSENIDEGNAPAEFLEEEIEKREENTKYFKERFRQRSILCPSILSRTGNGWITIIPSRK